MMGKMLIRAPKFMMEVATILICTNRVVHILDKWLIEKSNHLKLPIYLISRRFCWMNERLIIIGRYEIIAY